MEEVFKDVKVELLSPERDHELNLFNKLRA